MGSRLRASHETLNKGKSNDTNDYDDLDCEDLNNPIPLRRRLGSGNNREGDGDSDADTNNKMKQNGRNTDQHVPATNPTSNQAPGKVIAKKGIAPPPGPPPRKAIDVMAKDTSDDENDSDVKGERGRSNSRSNTRSVDEILKEPPMGRTALADQLYDDEEDGMEMDIKVLSLLFYCITLFYFITQYSHLMLRLRLKSVDTQIKVLQVIHLPEQMGLPGLQDPQLKYLLALIHQQGRRRVVDILILHLPQIATLQMKIGMMRMMKKMQRVVPRIVGIKIAWEDLEMTNNMK
jgi:hypothetical protein